MANAPGSGSTREGPSGGWVRNFCRHGDFQAQIFLEHKAESVTLSDMKTLARYLEVIVDPTFDDFLGNTASFRHAYLVCVAIFHAVDRAAEERGVSPKSLREKWGRESMEFKLVDILAHHFKHVQSYAERNIPATRPGIPIRLALGFDEAGEDMDLRNLYFVIRDAVRFVHKKAGTTHPKLP